MAGTYERFSATRFRDGVWFAMRMGAAIRPEDRAIFHFKPKRVYPEGTKLDQAGKPLNPSVKAQYERPESLTIEEVAVEVERATPDEMPVGTRIPTRVVITMLDEQYNAIKARAKEGGEEFAFEVELGGDRYRIGYRPPPLALFEVGVYQIVCFAVDES